MSTPSEGSGKVLCWNVWTNNAVPDLSRFPMAKVGPFPDRIASRFKSYHDTVKTTNRRVYRGRVHRWFDAGSGKKPASAQVTYAIYA